MENGYKYNADLIVKKIIKNTLFVSLLILITACTKMEKTISEDIKNDKEKYNELAETVDKCNFSRFSNGQFISKEYFPKTLNEVLKKTKLKNKVEYIVLIKSPNCEQKSFELICKRYQVMYNPCPESDFPLPDSYLKEGLIETWGIDNNWIIWKDNDYI